QDIKSLKYRVIITSPECILNDWRFLELQWSGDFRPEYAEVGRLCWLLPGHVVFYVASATLPSHVLGHIKSVLQMQSERTREIRLSNDRPNIHLLTLEMLDPINSCHDILRVLRFNRNPPPPPFMVFCNDRKETERLCLFAHSHAPSELVGKLLWFHSGMSTSFQTETIKKLRLNEIWGIFCTDAAGMGLDLRNIKLVVQWKHTKSFCMLWQRLGRAARDPSTEATRIYIVKPKFMDRCMQTRQKAAMNAGKSQQRQLHGVPDTVDVTSTSTSVHVQSGKAGPSSRKRPRHQCDQPEPDSGASHTTGRLIVQEEKHKNYEEAAMDAYINAHSRGVCRCGISNEFFGNRPHTYLESVYWNSV
ncbi:P-loop containing nucleoside triphosphate hydrolase protein, partial [Lactarius indigo]